MRESVWVRLFVLSGVVLTAAGGGCQTLTDSNDLLARRSAEFAGAGAIDCGVVKIRDNPRTATNCALAAQKTGKAFRIRYDLMGIDSAVAVALVRDPKGVVTTLDYDGNVAGGGGRGAEVVRPKPCPVPVHLWLTSSGRIDCFQQQTAKPKDAMSPNAEPY